MMRKPVKREAIWQDPNFEISDRGTVKAVFENGSYIEEGTVTAHLLFAILRNLESQRG